MNVGLVVEDYHAEALVEICRKISVNPEIRRQRGRINLKKASRYVKQLIYDYDCEKVIILADANCNPEGEKERLNGVYPLLPEELRGRVHISLAVHELESWLLADEDAVSKILRRDVKAIANPEEIHDAKGYLDELFKKAGKIYLTSLAKAIASSADLDKITAKSASFEDFRDKVGDCFVGDKLI